MSETRGTNYYSASYRRISSQVPPLSELFEEILRSPDLSREEVLFLLAPVFLELGDVEVAAHIYRAIAGSGSHVSIVAKGALSGLGIDPI